ncbi:hypothetical protein FJT64_015061 [Amphibalanus amphitrite]|uniref:CCHC-type domain-containing protein n=1 Tax=Amphibalanus amphitrite TaxID=1232801 RepID=A0A6A4XHG2_AMPAM|nr:hypothetical protein FJT64_015061 [Amphibalanus amphitrite]
MLRRVSSGRQLPVDHRASLAAVKSALFAAFALDSFAAYDAFVTRRLQPGESADVYLADLRRLAELFGGVPDRTLSCAFVNGLPDAARQVIRAGSRAEALDLPSVVARARAVLSDDRVATVAAATAAPPRGGGGSRGGTQDAEAVMAARVPRRPRSRRCWACGRLGHLAAGCPQGNGTGSGAAVPDPPDRVTRRSVFAWCGRLVAHLPVCGWLRPAAAWVKRRANAVTRGWDDVTTDALLQSQISHVHSRLLAADPARGQWCWTGDQAIVWTDASSIAAGVVIETPCGGVMEDACWLRPGDAAATHINMAELDAAVRGLNLAVAWGVTNIDLRTDSATVHRWVDDALSGRARLRTRAAGEMLIRRRVDLIRQLANELELKVTVTLVRSEENLADALTRVPKEWLRDECEESRMSVMADDGAGDSAARGQTSHPLVQGWAEEKTCAEAVQGLES